MRTKNRYLTARFHYLNHIISVSVITNEIIKFLIERHSIYILLDLLKIILMNVSFQQIQSRKSRLKLLLN